MGSAFKSDQPYIDGEREGASIDDVDRGSVVAARRARTVTIDGGVGGPSLPAPSSGDEQSGIGRRFGDCSVVEFASLKTLGWSAGRP